MPKPESYRKAIRLMKQAEKFHRPIITFIDTKGAYPGIDAEERGQSEAIAKSMFEMSNLAVPIISFIIGEGSSGGAIALTIADKIFMLENAIYSIISPEGYASILWKDSSKKKEAAEEMKLTANDLLKFNIIDEIIKEPNDGVKMENIIDVANCMKEKILYCIESLQNDDINNILKKRYDKYRNI